MSAASFHHLIRRGGRAVLFLTVPFAAGPLCAQILDWEAAIAEVSTGNSRFTEVEAIPGDGTATPASAFACGGFFGNFSLVGLPPLTNPTGQDGVVVRFDRSFQPPPFNWNPVWIAQAASTNEVEIRDLVFDSVGNFYITGTFTNDVVFSGVGGPTLTTPIAGATEGFVAWGELSTGDFLGAFITTGMQPEAIALDVAGTIYLTGGGALARRYPPGGGVPDWTTTAPAGTDAFIGIALDPDPTNPNLYVLIENNSSARSVVAVEIDRATGATGWSARVGGTGLNVGGGIGLDPNGELRVAFSSRGAIISLQSPTVTFNLPDIPTVAALHGVVLNLDPAGELIWSTVLGQAQNTASSMTTSGLSIDQAGNTFTSAGMNGNFLIEANPITANQDAAVFGVDATGLLFDFHQSNGPGVERPTGIAAPTRDLLVTVGDYESGPSNFSGIVLPVPDQGESHALLGALTPVENQALHIVTPIGPIPTVAELIDELHQLGGQVYNVIESRGNGVRVSSFLTNDQAATIRADVRLNIENDFLLQPAGSSSDSGWALNHLNDATNGTLITYPYSYADTVTPVNVYLIDTAVENSSGWFDANTNLTIEPTTLVRGFGDPVSSSVFQHGTEMLSLLGGPDTGAALGTPLIVKNFDFYPNGSPSTASLLADAIYEAIDHHLDHSDCKPGLIVISSSGASLGSATVSSAIDEAILEGIPVIVSAGNANADAAGYIPASDGTTSGVICVGASTQARAKEAGSNHTTIDLSAPGDAVRVVDYSDPTGGGYGSFTGTSASAALVGAVAAAHLSINPWSTPADLETAIAGDIYLDGGSGLSILQLVPAGAAFTQTYDDWVAYYSLADATHAGDDDEDGWSNYREFFHGLKPTMADPKGAQSWISYDNGTNEYTFSFNISSVLLNATSLGDLLDGGSYEVTDSSTGTSFTTAPGTIAVGSSTGAQTELSLTNTAVDPTCLLRVEITTASPSP